MPVDDYELRILRSLRRIIRVVDIHSRKINSEFKTTVPQLLCLYSISRNPEQTMSDLAKDVNLGISTVNGIVDRLEVKALIKRIRGEKDRRKVFLELTRDGKKLVKNAPPLLQEQLSTRLKELPELEQAAISLSLEKIIQLMEGEHVDASPNLIPDGALNKETDST
ncbi:MAG: MarR family transcriptional regulator [Planctomycetes bacterium]|nr:MarR family transcriptional regulator [Planctomycetota bacterium]